MPTLKAREHENFDSSFQTLQVKLDCPLGSTRASEQLRAPSPLHAGMHPGTCE